MITPFAADDAIDHAQLRQEAQFLKSCEVDGLVVAGSTGEGAGMSEPELGMAIRTVIEAVEGAIPVIGGVIADSSEEAVRLGMAAKKAGAAALQVPPPHFYFSTERQILAVYYRAITEATQLPLIIYNVIPWAQLAVDVLREITSENPLIIAIKQSGRNIHALVDLLAHLKGQVKIFSAIDDMIFPSFVLGVDGTISGTSSLFPRETVDMMRAVRSGNFEAARRLHERILPVWRFVDRPDFPSRIKCVMTLMGRRAGRPRRPFDWPDPDDVTRVHRILEMQGFLRAGTPPRLERSDEHTAVGIYNCS